VLDSGGHDAESPDRKPKPVNQRPARCIRCSSTNLRWLEERGPHACLMNMLDDSSGDTLARLGSEEMIWAAAGMRVSFPGCHACLRRRSADAEASRARISRQRQNAGFMDTHAHL
jgi:hypothetical protein